MNKAKKTGFTSDLHTATTATHPDSGDHAGRASFSGRDNILGPTKRVGGGSLPSIKVDRGRGPGADAKPNGGTFKPGRRGGC
jgi:hypothetical protein